MIKINPVNTSTVTYLSDVAIGAVFMLTSSQGIYVKLEEDKDGIIKVLEFNDGFKVAIISYFNYVVVEHTEIILVDIDINIKVNPL